MKYLCKLLVYLLAVHATDSQVLYGYARAAADKDHLVPLQWISIDSSSGEITTIRNFTSDLNYGFETAYWVILNLKYLSCAGQS